MMNELIIVKPSKSLKAKKIISNIIKVSLVVLVLLITYLPIIYIAVQSVNADGTGNRWNGLTFKWYMEMLTDKKITDPIKMTLVIAVLSTLISTVFGTITAIGINSLNKKHRKKFILLNNVPILNADIVTGIFLLLIFQFIGTLLGMGNQIFGFTTLLIAHILFSTPYVILSVLPKLSELDNNMLDAAMDLGCRPMYALRKVIIPSIQSGIISGMLLAFTMSIDDFVISYFAAGSGVQNFSIWLYNSRKITKNNPWAKASAYNTLIMLICIAGIFIYYYIKNKKTRRTNK